MVARFEGGADVAVGVVDATGQFYEEIDIVPGGDAEGVRSKEFSGDSGVRLVGVTHGDRNQAQGCPNGLNEGGETGFVEQHGHQRGAHVACTNNANAHYYPFHR